MKLSDLLFSEIELLFLKIKNEGVIGIRNKNKWINIITRMLDTNKFKNERDLRTAWNIIYYLQGIKI